MTIYISPQKDVRYSRFSNRSRDGFEMDNDYWSSVEQFLQARRFAGTPLEHEIRKCYQINDLDALIARNEWPPRPDWDDVWPELLQRALLSKFEGRLDLRSVLLATGDERIMVILLDDLILGVDQDGNGSNFLGRALEEVRRQVRKRAEDVDAVQCAHQDARIIRQACIHLMERKDDSRAGYYQYYSGPSPFFALVCPACKEDPTLLSRSLRKLCSECGSELVQASSLLGVIGEPAYRERLLPLAFDHRLHTLANPPQAPILDLKPVLRSQQERWIAITEDGKLVELDFERNAARELIQVDRSQLNADRKITLHISADGRFAAVVNTRGQFGQLWDLHTGKQTKSLDRGDDHIEHCHFSAAFFEMDGKQWLVHATAWNRLDICDPETGQTATNRTIAGWKQGEPAPEHYLDYFHCELLVSPDNEWIMDWGWVWHPYGVMRAWSLRAWLKDNCLESEDGVSVKEFCGRAYYWDGPACWIDSTHLAVWGYGDDADNLIPAVTMMNARTGEEKGWFPGPLCDGELIEIEVQDGVIQLQAAVPRSLVFERYLFAINKVKGTTVWDALSGELVQRAPDFYPTAFHPTRGTFLTDRGDGSFVLSRLVDLDMKKK